MLAASIGAVMAVAVTSVAAAQAPTEDQRCAEPYAPVRNVPRVAQATGTLGSMTGASLDPETSSYDLAFKRSRRARRLQVKFTSDDPFPSNLPVNEVGVAVELSRGSSEFVNDALSVSSSVRGSQLLVSVCIDPAGARRMPPGRYAGTVTIDDPRLAPASVPFTVTLQYERWGLVLGGYLALLLVGGTLFVWLGAAHARGEPMSLAALRTDLPQFLRVNIYGLLVGVGAALVVWKTQYLDDAAWSGELGQHITLLVAMGPAFVGSLAGAVVRRAAGTPSDAAASSPASMTFSAAHVPAPSDRVPAGQPATVGTAREPAVAIPDILTPAEVGGPVGSGRGRGDPDGTPTRELGPRSSTVRKLALVAVVVAVAFVPVLVALRGEEGRAQGDDLSVDGTGFPLNGPAPLTVPDVFDADADAAVAALEDAGFTVFAYSVCSSSVAAGRVREVATADGEVLVDRGGPTEAARTLEVPGALEVKVSSGTPCQEEPT